MKITDKDWNRMSDLVLSGTDGAKTAKIIKDKNKAIARLIAGLKLDDSQISFSESFNEFHGSFSEFGNKALELGATIKEIQSIFDETELPRKFINKLINLKDKKLNNRFVGDISRTILNAGLDIKFIPSNGNALTNFGRDAMARNGRKWTIGYKAEILVNGQKHNLTFDAITDEGDGPTTYVLDDSNSSNIFGKSDWGFNGKLQFIKKIKEAITV